MYVSLLLVFIVALLANSSNCAENDTKCQLHLQDVIVGRTLTKAGFHRDVITIIEWTSQDDCTILIQESLPSGMYVDLDQVNMLNQGFKIRSSSKVDVEAPAHKATTQVLWVYPSYQQYNSSRKSHRIITVTLPVHLRYHKPSLIGKTYETVSLAPPKVFAKCDGMTVKEDCDVVDAACSATGTSTCKWNELQHKPIDVFCLVVPVGRLTSNHGLVVTITTLLCTLLGTVWILSTIVH